MKLPVAIALLFAIANSVDAFTGSSPAATLQRQRHFALSSQLSDDIDKQTMGYKAGKADHPFAKRFGHLAGKKVRTVAEAMKDFTNSLGLIINPLYRSMITDIVSTTHLTVVDARFKYDKVWGLGLISSMDMLLKNYPEKDMAAKIVEAFCESMGFRAATLRKDAEELENWAKGKSGEDVAAALRGEGSSDLAAIAKVAKDDEFWLYSRFFGIGLMKMMQVTGVELTADNVNKWVNTDLGKDTQKAESDLTLWNGIQGKLEMMETLMKEIEIREKKKQAERLEQKAEAAMKKAEAAIKAKEEAAKEEATAATTTE